MRSPLLVTALLFLSATGGSLTSWPSPSWAAEPRFSSEWPGHGLDGFWDWLEWASNLPVSENPPRHVCDIHSKKGEVCDCTIESLHPTQFSVGLKEIRKRQKTLLRFKPKKLIKHIHKHPIPIVVSPKGELYLIDHHHLIYALWDLSSRLSIPGYQEMTCQIEQNFSETGLEEFWKTMEFNHWVYLWDREYKEVRHWSELPKQIGELENDPYRSLAKAVQTRKGYLPTKVPFAEFMWAKYFKEHGIDLGKTEEDYENAIQMALILAKDPAAKALPGFQQN